MEKVDPLGSDPWGGRVPASQAPPAENEAQAKGFAAALEAARAEESRANKPAAREAETPRERQAIAANEQERREARQTEARSHTDRVEILAGLDLPQLRRIVAAEIAQVGLEAAQKAKRAESGGSSSARAMAVEAYREIARQDGRNLGI